MNRQNKRHRAGECCVRGADGSLSDYPIQEELVEGIDDSGFRARTRAALLAAGVPAEHLNRLFPSFPVSIPFDSWLAPAGPIAVETAGRAINFTPT